ncbi:MAG: hypothetical protein ABI700_12460 [Chloroflexota bacterium]
MPELPDRQLEADIARSLKYDTLITPLRREDARTRLLRSAAAQTALPPVEVVQAEHVLLRDHAHSFVQLMMCFYRFLMVDSMCYERARRPPSFFQLYNIHGRGTFINVSA